MKQGMNCSLTTICVDNEVKLISVKTGQSILRYLRECCSFVCGKGVRSQSIEYVANLCLQGVDRVVKFLVIEVNILGEKADSDFYVCAAKEKEFFCQWGNARQPCRRSTGGGTRVNGCGPLA